MNKAIFVWVGVAAVLGALFVGSSSLTGRAIGQSDGLDSFAACLAERGVTMYGAYWCPHCQRQKRLFGDAWENVNSVECALPGKQEQAEVCTRAGIRLYPTWIFSDGERYEGELTLEQLAERSGCPLNG